ncbi:MAG: nitroreductase family protein [Oscillospiraceae bacterium]|jgi:nitroreductase|nr:nitroreductase family protein [Oscillospiraceae bacterium]
MNETLNSIFTRYSCRKFTDKLPCDKDLQTIAKAAVAAPSGMDRQLWQVILLKNQELMSEMETEGLDLMKSMPDKSLFERIQSRGGKLFYNASCMMIVAIKSATPPGAELFDCGILAENVCLAATSLGIQSCMCGFTAFCFAGNKRDEFKKTLGFAEGFEIGILLGYADMQGKPHELDLAKISLIK